MEEEGGRGSGVGLLQGLALYLGCSGRAGGESEKCMAPRCVTCLCFGWEACGCALGAVSFVTAALTT